MESKNTNAEADRCLTLTCKLFDGVVSGEEREELQELLVSSDDAAEVFASYAYDSVALRVITLAAASQADAASECPVGDAHASASCKAQLKEIPQKVANRALEQHATSNVPTYRRRVTTYANSCVLFLMALFSQMGQRVRRIELPSDGFMRGGLRWLSNARVPVACVLLLATLCGVLGLFLRTRQSPLGAVITAASYQALIRSDSGVGRRLFVGDQISPGERVHIDDGTVELRFGDGTIGTAHAPARLSVLGTDRCRVWNGTMSAEVSQPGFVVETPLIDVQDLGTEFGVTVRRDQSTDVAVARGSVQLYAKNTTSGMEQCVLVENQAARAVKGSDGQTVMARIPLDNVAQLEKYSSGVGMTISGVSSNSGLVYEVVPGGFREDAPTATDRGYEWNGVSKSGLPSFLVGGDYVKVPFDDKLNRRLLVEVRLARPCFVFLLLNQLDNPPDWLLRDFEKTVHTVGLDRTRKRSNAKPASGNSRMRLGKGPGRRIDATFSVWRRKVSCPSSLTLGARNAKEDFGTYGIIAIPLH
ncbi:FecR domain-containing protein [Adhaeretor mobilis]|uniref:FecR protein n=1 Tax=Adhaeretor mobilis TaxID=1930276 RepID=A0A517MTP8_9BACT|nr:FecR domain-containing protein [Adhaeretor mobilis]QDS98157.1 FecR protein [Adhaeretor mobilis]